MGSLPVTTDSSDNAPIRSTAVDSKTPQRVYAAGPAGLFRSDDGGLKWTAAGKGLNGTPLAVTLDPQQPQTLFTILADDTVWQSDDGATTWKVVGSSK